jgi:hypothetical protein
VHIVHRAEVDGTQRHVHSRIYTYIYACIYQARIDEANKKLAHAVLVVEACLEGVAKVFAKFEVVENHMNE